MLRQIWSRREGADSNLVQMFVSNLKRKLGGSAAKPIWIINERAAGYRMAMPTAVQHTPNSAASRPPTSIRAVNNPSDPAEPARPAASDGFSVVCWRAF